MIVNPAGIVAIPLANTDNFPLPQANDVLTNEPIYNNEYPISTLIAPPNTVAPK